MVQTQNTWQQAAGSMTAMWNDTGIAVTVDGKKVTKTLGDVGAAAKKATDDGLKPMREALEKMDRLALVMPAHLAELADAVSALEPGVMGPPPELGGSRIFRRATEPGRSGKEDRSV